MQTATQLAPRIRYPQPVEIVQECDDCHGAGRFEVITGGWEVPRTKEVTCEECEGTGQVEPKCDVCGSPATARLTCSDPHLTHFCSRCATSGLEPSDGLDFVISFALAVLP